MIHHPGWHVFGPVNIGEQTGGPQEDERKPGNRVTPVKLGITGRVLPAGCLMVSWIPRLQD